MLSREFSVYTLSQRGTVYSSTAQVTLAEKRGVGSTWNCAQFMYYAPLNLKKGYDMRAWANKSIASADQGPDQKLALYIRKMLPTKRASFFSHLFKSKFRSRHINHIYHLLNKSNVTLIIC